METKNKTLRLGDLKKVDTIEEFRDVLLKLFVSNQERREIYVLPSYLNKLYGKGAYYYPVDKIDTLYDLMTLDCHLLVKVKDKKFYTKNNHWHLEKEEILNLEFILETEEYFKKVKNLRWYHFPGGKLGMIIENIGSTYFFNNYKFPKEVLN